MTNLEDNRRYVFSLLARAKIPYQNRDDVYQDFAVFFYSRGTEYNPEYAITTWISLLFKSFLSHRASRYNAVKRKGHTVDSELILDMGYGVDFEASIDLDRLYVLLPDIFKTLLTTDHTPATLAALEGVTRQAIESKVKKLMALATVNYIKDYT